MKISKQSKACTVRIARLVLLAMLMATSALPVSSVRAAMWLTGTIHTLHVNTGANRGHIYFDGQPLFDGGSCSGIWTGNSLDDDKFMIYIWPALMNAKNHNFTVSVYVDGCEGGYPKITAIDVIPR